MSDREIVELEDEKRSNESDDSPGSLTDFIVDDSARRRVPTTTVQGSDIPTLESMPTSGYVSIFNTSDRATEVGGKDSAKGSDEEKFRAGQGQSTTLPPPYPGAGSAGQEKGPRVPGQRVVQDDYLQARLKSRSADRTLESVKTTAGRSLPSEGEGDLLNVGDLTSYQGTTVSEQSRSAQVVPRPTGGGETKVDRLADQSGKVKGPLTQALYTNVTTGAPPVVGGLRGGKVDGLPLSTRETGQPRKSAGPKTGEVDMDWESMEETEPRRSEEVSERERWYLEGAKLGEDLAVAERDLMEALEKCWQLLARRDEHLVRGGEIETLAEREVVLSDHARGGDIMSLILMEADKLEKLAIRPVDMALGLQELWKDDWTLVENSKRTKFGSKDVKELMEQTSRLMEDLREDLASALGQEELEAFEARHHVLASGLSTGRIPAALAPLFPKEAAPEIMQWYLRWASGLLVMHRQREWLNLEGVKLGEFLRAYPGPREVVKREVVEPVDRPAVLPMSGRFARSEGSTRSGLHHTSQPKPDAEKGTLEVPNPYQGTQGESPYGGHPGLTREMIRDHAVGYGYNYRPPISLAEQGLGGAPINWLGQDQVRPKGHGSGREDGAASNLRDDASQEESLQSRMSSIVEESLDGFAGMNRTMIEEEVRVYVTEQLEKQGNATPLAIGILVENIPRLGVYTRKGHSASVTSAFTKHARDMKPHTDGPFISMHQWWRMLKERADDNGWSLPMLVRFIARTGGLAEKVNEGIRKRVIDLMKNYQSWLPHYEPQRSELDNRYWLYLWLDVGLKIIKEFHMVQSQEAIEGSLRDILEDPKYLPVSHEDPLNEDFHRIVSLHEDLYMVMNERSCDLVSSPAYVYRMVKRWLKKKWGLAGTIAVNFIEKALAKLSTEPESVLPRHHMLSKAQMQQVRLHGQGMASANTYRLILEQLKLRAVKKDLEYTAHSLRMLEKIHKSKSASGESEWEMCKADRKRERKAHVALSSDVSTLTLNTVATSTITPKGRPCQTCAMFHGPPQDTCPFWDQTKRRFNILNFLKFRSVRQIAADGSSTVNDYWLKKLKLYGFRGMGITDEAERNKILKDLKDTAANFPAATIEERRRWNADNKAFIHMAKIEEGEIVATAVNYRVRTATTTGGSSAKEDTDSSSSSGLDSNSSSEASDDLA